MAHDGNLSPWEEENYEFEASLGYTVRHCFINNSL